LSIGSKKQEHYAPRSQQAGTTVFGAALGESCRNAGIRSSVFDRIHERNRSLPARLDAPAQFQLVQETRKKFADLPKGEKLGAGQWSAKGSWTASHVTIPRRGQPTTKYMPWKVELVVVSRLDRSPP
jgi:hypothetical protein